MVGGAQWLFALTLQAISSKPGAAWMLNRVSPELSTRRAFVAPPTPYRSRRARALGLERSEVVMWKINEREDWRTQSYECERSR